MKISYLWQRKAFKWYGGLGILLLVVVTANSWYAWFRMPWAAVSPFEAVPTHAVFLLESDNTKPLAGLGFTNSPVLSLPLIKKYNSSLALLHQFAPEVDEAGRLRGNQVSAVMVSSAEQFDWLHVMPIAHAGRIYDKLKQLPGSTESHYRGYEILECIGKDSVQMCFMASKGLLIASQKSVLIEYAAEQLLDYNHCLTRQNGFQRITRKLQKGNLNVYIDFAQLPLLGTLLLAPERNDIKALASTECWVGISVKPEGDGLTLDGIAAPGDDAGILKYEQYASALPLRTEMEDFVPDNIAVLNYWGDKDLPALYSHLSSKSNRDFEDFILPWVDDQLIYALLEPATEDFTNEKVLMVKAKNIPLAESSLGKLSAKLGGNTPEKYLQFTLNRIHAPELMQPLLGKALSPVSDPWYCTVGNYVVMANSQSTLHLWLDKYVFGQTLRNSAAYQLFQQRLPQRTSYFCYINTAAAYQLIRAYSSQQSKLDLSSLYPALRAMNPLGMALTGEGNRYHFYGYIGLKSLKTERSADISWRADLQAPAMGTLSVLKSPDDGKPEFAIQDNQNRLYLIGTNGRIIWSRVLEGPILSQVFQSDYYTDGKPDYFFNTKGKIYILDREGKDLLHPLDIPGQAANGMLFVNYGNLDHIFVGSDNGNVYGFLKDGAPLDGWSPRTGCGKLTLPIQYCRSGDKDFLVAQNTKGEIHLMDRSGKNKISPVTIGDGVQSPVGFDLANKRIVAGAHNGSLHLVNYMTGGQFSLSTIAGGSTGRFAYADLCGDEKLDYAVLSGKNAAVYTYKGNAFVKNTAIALPEAQDDIFAVHPVGGGKSWFGTYSASSNHIYLYDGDGHLFKGFPLAGNGRFVITDLYGSGANMLIAPNGNTVFAYVIHPEQPAAVVPKAATPVKKSAPVKPVAKAPAKPAVKAPVKAVTPVKPPVKSPVKPH